MSVFISYGKKDIGIARKLYHDLKNRGLKPWININDILPGQNRKITIKQAIKDSDYCLMLLSSLSVSKRGFIHKE